MIQFRWSNNLYEFLCLHFGLGSAPQTFTKLLKVPISILRRLAIKIVIYLDDMLILGKTIDEVLMAKVTVILLLQHLGLKKSGKICFDTNTEDPVFRSNSRFDPNGIVTYVLQRN